MEMTINHLAVWVAALSTFLLGGLWFSPILFGKAWQTENQLSDADLKTANTGKIMGLSFLFALIMSYNLAFFLNDPSIDGGMGTMYGFFTGFGWIAMAIFIIGQFEHKSTRYMLINAGYMTIALTLMGLITGLWK